MTKIEDPIIPTVSILGCGWLGLPLGNELIAQNYAVKGSTTRPEKLETLAQAGILPYHLHFAPAPQGDDLADFLQAKVLIISLTPQVAKRGNDFHPAQIRHLCQALANSPIEQIIYLSSTSIYPEVNRQVFENEVINPQDDINLALYQAENILQNLSHCSVVILRCGGLMGYDRIPAKYFAGKKGLTTGKIPVNYVHRDDVIQIISSIIRQNTNNEVFNVVAPQHPPRAEVYAQNVADFGYAAPEFVDNEDFNFKIVNSDKLIQRLNYTFQYPNPLAFRYKL
ncbi:MAG: NAD(P)H-binding protein [Microscillaceae bacterium]|jgi:nucleoside-diphosphate-sugar epimerase|nr:NAD(P)H-binding protein [Microscillaceae bacterium]